MRLSPAIKSKNRANAEARIIWPAWLPRVILLRRNCPCCGSSQFKPGEKHPLDGIWALFALRPVRCSFCWRRYYSFPNRRLKWAS